MAALSYKRPDAKYDEEARALSDGLEDRNQG